MTFSYPETGELTLPCPQTLAMQLMIEVSPGDLIDRITILELKCQRLLDPAMLNATRIQLDHLIAIRQRFIASTSEIEGMTKALKEANQTLWEAESAIRSCEDRRDFGATFVHLARTIYLTNDHRANLKRQIDSILGSSLRDSKLYGTSSSTPTDDK